MNFADLKFWELCLGSLALVVALKLLFRKLPEEFDKTALLALGLLLLYCASEISFVIFISVAVGSYVGLKWLLMTDEKHHFWYLFILIPIQLLPLIFYKYGDFLLHDVLGIRLPGLHARLGAFSPSGEIPALKDLIIPVGISFYTFQKVAFVLDTLAFKKPLPSFLNYLNFAGFFPQVVAGPIERRNDLLPQMEKFRFAWSRENIDKGAGWIVLGFFFKLCLADNFGVIFETVRGFSESATNAYLIWTMNLLFGLRIYYDFAGYSLIALGIAQCLGVSLTLNFASPYCATSCTEFWRRWHITLSQWFRDYLYFPLGGGRVKWWAINVAIVFVISGVWHGAGWNFVLWGALHGAFLIVNRLFGRKISLNAFAGWLLTMAASFLAWLCFYELNTTVLMSKLQTLFTPASYSLQALRGAIAAWSLPNLLLLGCFLTLAGITLGLEWLSVKRNDPYCLLLNRGILIVLTVILAPGINNGFIYFAF